MIKKIKESAIAKPVAIQRKTQAIRIIGGQWKRTPLSVVEAEGLRPTPDRVRETVFNWLSHLLNANTQAEWQCVHALDLFAGSGALGWEAASRGAGSVTMVETHMPAFRQLEQVKQKLAATQVSLLRGDALGYLSAFVARQQQFDLIFLDPPFHQTLLPRLLPLCAQVLASNGYLYVEAEQALSLSGVDEMHPMQALPDWLIGWRLVRADKAGSVFFHLLQRMPELHGAPQNLG